MRKKTLLCVVVLVLIFSACGKEGRGMKHYYSETYFKNGLEKNIVLKGYSDPSISKYVYTYTIAQNETIRIMQYYLPQKIEIYDGENNKLLSSTIFSGTEEELKNYPNDIEFSQSNLSQHLKILKDAGIVISEKDGLRVNYSIYNSDIKKIVDTSEYIIRENISKI